MPFLMSTTGYFLRRKKHSSSFPLSHRPPDLFMQRPAFLFAIEPRAVIFKQSRDVQNLRGGVELS